MNAFATQDLQPEITFLFDIDPNLAQRRRAGEVEDRIETRGLEFQARVRAEYLHLAEENPQRVVTLDGAQSREALQQRTLEVLTARGVQF